MTLEIVYKPVAEPINTDHMQKLIAYRVTSISHHDVVEKSIDGIVDVGDIVFRITHYKNSNHEIINATKGYLIPTRIANGMLVKEAYDVEKIILMQDNTRAPIL